MRLRLPFFPVLLWPLAAATAWAQIEPAPLVPGSLPAIGGVNCNFTTGDLHFDCIPLYVAYIIGIVFSFIGTIFLLMIIYAGYEIIVSGTGVTDKSAAYGRMRNAIIGLAVSVLAYFLVNLAVSAVTSGAR